MQQIAEHLHWTPQTVRETIHRWRERGLGGLWEAEGRGRHRRWTGADWQALEQWVNEPRRYSAEQLSRKLSQQRQVELGKEQVRRILKKNYRWKRSRLAPPHQNTSERYQAKRVDWETLKLWESGIKIQDFAPLLKITNEMLFSLDNLFYLYLQDIQLFDGQLKNKILYYLE